jgi:PAS domain S-box-containing protein
MPWIIAGLTYSAAYLAIVLALWRHTDARLIVGNIALLLPPLVTIATIVRRRSAWKGRQSVFWAAILAWAVLWFVGQIAWSIDEVFRALALPWFKWYLVLQLSASAMPLIALVAWPHRGVRSEATVTAVLDIAVLTSLAAFLYWTLIIAPGMVPTQSALALRMLATIGPLIRLATVIGLIWAFRSANGGPWAAVYQRLALGMGLAFAMLVPLSFTAVKGSYQTGSPGDIGWMLPFWFAAAAATIAPASEPEQRRAISKPWPREHAALLGAAVIAVPIVGYAARYLIPLGSPLDGYRDAATTFAIVWGIALVMIRMRVEQRAVEQADERVRLLATACEQTAELIVIVRPDAIEYANDAFCRATGYVREELERLRPRRLVAPGSFPAVQGVLQTLERGEIARFTLTIARKDGTTFEAACAAAPIIGADGRVTRFVGVIHDLTEDLRLREQMVRSERLSAVGELVSGVAHELNSPLQVMIGTLDLALADPLAHIADLERVRLEALRAGTIIRSLLAFVRKSPRERTLCDLNEIVQATASLRTYELGAAGIAVREEYGGLLPLVLANRDEIQQVALNLILNAEQSIAGAGRGGEIVIRTLLSPSGADAVLEIADDGPGVPEEVRKRIFEPFFTTRAGGDATGLGLSIAFGIAAAHGGGLELVRRPEQGEGRGACFRLTLPGAGFPGPALVH